MDDRQVVHIVDDDDAVRRSAGFLLRTSGYTVVAHESGTAFLKAAPSAEPGCVLLDVRMPDIDGLEVQRQMTARGIAMPVVVLTGHGDLSVGIAAVKAGAVDYLAKPADADEIHGTLMAQPGERADPPENPMSADRVRWEHIQRVYELCSRNVSETARRLNMHRRTLQRILAKRAPR